MALRAVLVFLLVFATALLFGAILAYPVYSLLSLFSDPEFHRVISRTTLLSGLIFSLLYLRYAGALSLEGIAWRDSRNTRGILFLQGYLAGFLIMLLLVSSFIFLGIYHFDPSADTTVSALVKITIKGILAGLVVGLVEEVIFRGALLGGLQKQTNVVIAVVMTSLFYALVHFIKFRALPEGFEPGWFTGIEIFPAALFRYKFWPTLDACITLFILGIFFAMVRIRSASILPCIGMHAAIVLVMKVFFYLANYTEENNYAFLVNAYDHQFGYLSSGMLLLFLVLYYFIDEKRQVKTEKQQDNA